MRIYTASGRPAYRIEELDEPLVSVVVCAHDNASCIERCLGALAQSNYKRLDTIVFDDASQDGTARLVERWLPSLPGESRLLLSANNLGFVRACNEASLHARGEILFLLNSDAMIFPDTIGAFVRVLRDEPRLGVAGCKILEADERTIQCVGNRLSPNALGRPIGGGEEDRGQFDHPVDCEFVTGAALAIRTDLWFDASGFDEDFAPAYYEDMDLCLRLRAKGYRVAAIPSARVAHLGGQAYGAGSWRFIDLTMRNRIRLLVKHWARPKFFVAAAPYELWWMASWRSKRYRRASLRGYGAGVRQMGLNVARWAGFLRPTPLLMRRAMLPDSETDQPR
ncbi:MAG: glycosyltransferase family 2 protein [Candidatus Sumerlaeota bacterium]|nr:glycosyltransferase family 2 protein [Candidatus Sumerlaeota bacterium]